MPPPRTLAVTRPDGTPAVLTLSAAADPEAPVLVLVPAMGMRAGWYSRFAAEWRSGELSPEAEAIAAELGLEVGGPWRSLLESETFRLLLEEPAALDPAALRRAA